MKQILVITINSKNNRSSKLAITLITQLNCDYWVVNGVFETQNNSPTFVEPATDSDINIYKYISKILLKVTK